MRSAAAPSSAPPAAAPEAQSTTADGAGGGFAAAVRALVGRKYRELRGRRWERATERQRVAEATRRGREEMARRVRRETGRRMSASTVQKYARQNAAPPSVDTNRADRQAVVDKAGGLGRLAGQLGMSARKVSHWRDSGGELETPSWPMTITATVEGRLWCASKPPYRRRLTATITLTAEQAHPVRQAIATGDDSGLRAHLGRHITEQVDWSGELDRRYQIDIIEDISYQ